MINPIKTWFDGGSLIRIGQKHINSGPDNLSKKFY